MSETQPGSAVISYAAAGGIEQFNDKVHAEGRAILRVVKDLREMIATAPTDDPEARSLRLDCDTLERVGDWLTSTNAVTFP